MYILFVSTATLYYLAKKPDVRGVRFETSKTYSSLQDVQLML